MKIKVSLNWMFCGAALSRLALMSIGSLPGRRRVPPPSHSNAIYQIQDLKHEFKQYSLPRRVRKKFESAVKVHQAGNLQEALTLYLDMNFTEKDGSEFRLSEQSAVVAYNVYLIYKASGDAEGAHKYLTRYQDLQLKAEE